MRVERDIAGTALPFAIGTAALLYADTIMTVHPYGTAAASFLATLISLSILLHFRHNDTNWTSAYICVTVTMFACGLMTASTWNVIAVSQNTGSGWLTAMAEGFGERMKAAIDAIPFEDRKTGQLMKALLTGDREGMAEETVLVFRNSGASHILALSGLHLGIIYGIIRFLTRGFGNLRGSRYARSTFLIASCGFYTLATGAGASIVRAFIFIVIGECVRLSGRGSGLKNTLMTALMIHLTASPSSIKEVGFQLSYAAIAGIAFIFPWMQGFWPGDRRDDAPMMRLPRQMWDSAAMSISCQITTAPLAYMYFGTFPTQFILTNMIAIPLTGIIIPMALVTLGASALGWHPQMLVETTEWMISLLYGALSLLSTM